MILVLVIIDYWTNTEYYHMADRRKPTYQYTRATHFRYNLEKLSKSGSETSNANKMSRQEADSILILSKTYYDYIKKHALKDMLSKMFTKYIMWKLAELGTSNKTTCQKPPMSDTRYFIHDILWCIVCHELKWKFVPSIPETNILQDGPNNIEVLITSKWVEHVEEEGSSGIIKAMLLQKQVASILDHVKNKMIL
jgi:hypothetical protein